MDLWKLAFQSDDDWNGGGPSGSGDCDEDASTGVTSIFFPAGSNTETGSRVVAEGPIGGCCVWGSIFEILVVACSGGDELDCGIGRGSADAWVTGN